MQEVVGQNPHLQPGLVGLEPLAAGLIPTQSVFAFLDSVFQIVPPIVDLDHLGGWQSVVGDHKTDPGEKLPPMPLDLAHYPAGLASALRLVLQINHLDLHPGLRGTGHGPVKVGLDQTHQDSIGR